MDKWVKINTNPRINIKKNHSPLIRCLLNEIVDEQQISNLVSNNLPKGPSEKNHNDIIMNRVQKVKSIKEELSEKLDGREEEKQFCILALEHLISARYSGKSQSYSAIEYTMSKLSNAVAKHEPIIFTFCFGGYKCHTSPSHPEVDWAELFNLNYLVSYIYPIILNYKYGVEIEYESEEVSIQFNNVPQQLTDKYTNSFSKLLKYYSNKTQEYYNLKFPLSLKIAREWYRNEEELYNLMKEKKPSYEELFESLLKEEKKKWLQRAESNIMWVGGIKTYNNISDKQRCNIIKEARINNEAFLEADYILREDFFEQDNRIPLTGTWGRMPSAQPIDGWLHIKSTEASLVDCWIGTGFLEARKTKKRVEYLETIKSKNQIEKVQKNIKYFKNPDNELKSVSSNFNRLPVIEKRT